MQTTAKSEIWSPKSENENARKRQHTRKTERRNAAFFIPSVPWIRRSGGTGFSGFDFLYAFAATLFIFSSPVFATSSGSWVQYFRLNNSSERTFCPPDCRRQRRISGKGAMPLPG